MDTGRVRQYFRRLGLPMPEKPVPDGALLQKLHNAHATVIPYENTQYLLNDPIRLDTDTLYEHIVTEGYGGVCLDLNGLFKWLLNELGYEAEDITTIPVLNGERFPQFPHRVLRVRDCEGRLWWCDVGDSIGICREPMLFVPELEQLNNGVPMKLVPTEKGCDLTRLVKGAWMPVFCYEGGSSTEGEFYENKLTSFRSDCMLREGDVFSLKTFTGAKTFSGGRYRESVNGVLTTIPATEENLPWIYAQFGLKYETFRAFRKK